MPATIRHITTYEEMKASTDKDDETDIKAVVRTPTIKEASHRHNMEPPMAMLRPWVEMSMPVSIPYQR